MNSAKAILPRFEKGGMAVIGGLGWLPLMLLPIAATIFGLRLAPWIFMWLLAFAIFAGCKWLTWWEARAMTAGTGRNLAYLLGWPGMDAKAFLKHRRTVAKPVWNSWAMALIKIIFGAILIWGIARLVPVNELLVRGWIGLVGLIFLLHFGTFHLVALGWQYLGIDAQPLMRAPIKATSLSEFWGRRWNSAFNRLVHDILFRRFYRHVGKVGAVLGVFVVSGIIHELVISVPARAGYGLPTAYFLLQGMGLVFERSAAGERLCLGRGFAGWLFTVVMTAGPAYWLFHPAFITRVIIPFMKAIHAI